MKKIIASQYLSLDGVLEDPVGMESSGLGNWTGPYSRGEKGDAFKHAELFACESLLLGRRTYDGFAAVWPTIDDEAGFAKQINAMPKHVVSTTLKTAEWNNTTIIDSDVVARVKALKSEPGGDMLVYGSGMLLHTLMRAGLVDRYNLMIYPTVLGRGIRLFPDDWKEQLTLDECTEFGSGIVSLRYSAC
ncbi:dihydrofolate reductase family protein [Sphingosinicella terrae]|uniref:dihydrofolate reductase family protein n=1 Tax=Sphingosinicella terrae TaxID=2172047 RepID=UPI0013B390C8|nr:dihydrofolate reductase family protein [Sphingosinicella terrae]